MENFYVCMLTNLSNEIPRNMKFSWIRPVAAAIAVSVVLQLDIVELSSWYNDCRNRRQLLILSDQIYGCFVKQEASLTPITHDNDANTNHPR